MCKTPLDKSGVCKSHRSGKGVYMITLLLIVVLLLIRRRRTRIQFNLEL